ncbi:hypothetical protein HY375_00680 [Candidatus Berkelbacteria bacterium]|nr:hypothetical protein [Candidatus Berkelbacteria bacterium]
MNKRRIQNKPPAPRPSGEPCARCHKTDEDRRTLQAACFYDLSELKIPFGRKLVLTPVGELKPEACTEVKPPVTLPLQGRDPVMLVPPTLTYTGDVVPEDLFTLRLCKDCRADFMVALSIWWNTTPTVRRGADTGIFVREYGAVRELTVQEAQARWPEWEPPSDLLSREK